MPPSVDDFNIIESSGVETYVIRFKNIVVLWALYRNPRFEYKGATLSAGASRILPEHVHQVKRLDKLPQRQERILE